MSLLRNNQSGFAFIELILTTFVLSVGLMGGYILMNNSISNSVSSDYNVVASQFANEKLEMIIADKAFHGYASVDENDYPAEVMEQPYQGVTRTVNIYEVNPADMSTEQVGSGYKKVTVNVVWGNEDFETINVVTVLTDYGS